MDIVKILAASGLINGIGALLFGIEVVRRNKKEFTTRLFLFLAGAIAMWSLAYWQWLSSADTTHALLFIRLLSVGAIFIPTACLHWVVSFLGLNKQERRAVMLVYAMSIVYTVLIPTRLMLEGIEPRLMFSFWPIPGPVYVWYILFHYVGFFGYSIHLLAKEYRKTQDKIIKAQIRYIIGGIALGITGGATNFPLWYGIPFVPLGNLLVIFFPGALMVASVRYQLFNIKLLLAEILVAFIWLIAGLETLLSETQERRWMGEGLLVLAVIVGIVLVRSVKKEVEQKERLQKLTEDLEKANEELKRTEKLKAEFFSFAAHQVKSPMAVIKGYASLIFDGAFTGMDKVKEVGKKINMAASRTLTMVNNLLDMRKIEEGRMVYAFEKTDVVAPIRTITNDLETLAKEKGLTLTFESSQDEIVLNMDIQKFTQVIQNLIDNAVKYTDVGWVKVRVELNDGKVLFTVSDSGRGISKEFASKMFEQFARDPALAQDTKGTGLGLFIAKQIVEAHGGTIHAESEGEGSGSRFIVEVPINNGSGELTGQSKEIS